MYGPSLLDNGCLHIGYCVHGSLLEPFPIYKGALLNSMFDTSKIGQSFPAFTIEVERVKVHELALAINDASHNSPLRRNLRHGPSFSCARLADAGKPFQFTLCKT